MVAVGEKLGPAQAKKRASAVDHLLESADNFLCREQIELLVVFASGENKKEELVERRAFVVADIRLMDGKPALPARSRYCTIAKAVGIG
jgi:hypothetical protein